MALHYSAIVADGLPEWKRTAIWDDETDTIYLPGAVLCGTEEAAMMKASFDGVGYLVDGGHVYVPSSWAKRECPKHADAIAKAEANIRNFYQKQRGSV